MSSLAAQLQGIASLDASRLTSRFGAPTSKSYLFPPKVAASHDLDSIFSLAQSGYDELLQLDPRMSDFEAELFSEAARRTDRMMLSKEENAKLDVVLAQCLRRLGRWIGIMAGGKCVEWLVRRFRVNEMNAEVLLQVFLPYHDSPNFARMLAILTLPTTSVYHAPFSALIKAAQPVPRSYLSTAFSAERDPSLRLLTHLVGMVKLAADEEVVHRALLGFWTSMLVDMLEKSGKAGKVPEGVVRLLVETFVVLMSHPNGGQDINAAVYPPLVLLSRSVHLADGPFSAILQALLSPDSGANPSQRLLTLLVLLDQRPGWTGGLGKNGATALVKIPQVGQLIVLAMDKYGFLEALKPVLAVMAEKPSVTAKALTTVVDHASLPDVLVRIVATKLVASSSEGAVAASRTLLETLRQRQPQVIDSVLTENSATIDPKFLNLSQKDAAFVNVHSADSASRVAGIQEVYNSVKLLGLNAENAADLAKSNETVSSAQDAILARIKDEEESVVRAIYAEPELLLALVSGGKDYIDAVTPVFAQPKINQQVARAHLRFVAEYLLSTSNSLARVFEHLFVPVLLSTESRMVLGKNEFALFGKVKALAFFKDVVTSTSAQTSLPDQNKAAIKATSAALFKSSESAPLISSLLSSLNSDIPQARLFASITLAEAFASLTAAQQVRVAGSALASLDALAALELREIVEVETPLSDELHKVIASKPSGARTIQRASLVLLTSIARISHAQDPSWMLHETAEYKTVVRSLYRWANLARLSPSVGRHILQSVLAQVGDNALVFLASEWAGSNALTRVAALRHATAFVQAYAGQEKQSQSTDFQMVVPALLVALQDQDATVRQAAAALLKSITTMAEGATEIYALDTVYGPRSDSVQLLKPSDLQKYLQTIVGSADEIAIDPSRLAMIHSTSLDAQSKAGKKDASYRRAIGEWLMSHVVAWRADGPRQSLLLSLARTINPSRLRGVVPLLSPLVGSAGKDESESAWIASLRGSSQQAYLDFVFDAFTTRHVSALTDEGSESWALLLSLLQVQSPSELSNRLRVLSIERLAAGLFEALPRRHKVEYVIAFISSLHLLSIDDVIGAKAVLPKFTLDAEEIIEVVQIMLEPLEGSSQRKKAKHDALDESEKTERAVTDLTVLVESRDWKTLPGNAPLVASLMGVLSTLLSRRPSIKEGGDYLEQEVLAAVLAQVEKIEDAIEIMKAHVGIEVIIKVIRASPNPRTSQRALLVASELARLIPDAVLHNVMPIFTFMGDSDLHRDDAFSFSVVEKTVARIVPVMTRSLREKAETKLDLYNASLTFVSIFTDMAGRLPRHRTVPFFIHLVKSLGASDYLAPICMLFLDKLTTKAGRSINGLSELPVGLVAAFNVDVRVETLFELISEVSRLVDDLATIAEQKQAFLNNVANDDSEHTLKQISALLRFSETITAQLTGKPCDQSKVEATVKMLVQLAAATSQPSFKGSDVVSSVRSTLAAAMQLLSVEGFLAVTSQLLSGSEQDATRVLEVFTQRLPLVRADLRVKCAPAVAAIVRQIATLLSERIAMLSSLSALHAVATSAISADDSALAAVVPAVVAAASAPSSEVDVITSALSLVEVLARHLTSRIIPYIQSIVKICLDLTSSQPTSAPSYAAAKQAFTTLSALIEAVASFINNKQLVAILNSAAAYRATDEVVSSRVLSVAAKKIPTKALFPVVMDLWKVVQTDPEQSTLEAFFHLLRLTLRNADRKALPGLIKPIFAFFLDIFDLRHRLQKQGVDIDAINAIETSAIASFLELVTKLNESTFKPLFVRLYDWAVIDLAEAKGVDDGRLVERKIVLLHVMMGLLDKFRHLLSAYIGVLLPHIEELLTDYAEEKATSVPLWTLMLDVLAKSFDVDEGAFWTEALLTKLVPLLVAQLSIFPDLTSTSSSPAARALASLAASTTSEPLLKRLNTSICLSTRAEHPRQRMVALVALDAVWERHADEMVVFVPETVAEFLSELIEDENAEVEGMARKVVSRIETVTGSLKEYLE